MALPTFVEVLRAHDDYHKPSDTAAKINAIGGAQVALLVADVAKELADRPERLAYKAAAPEPEERK